MLTHGVSRRLAGRAVCLLHFQSVTVAPGPVSCSSLKCLLTSTGEVIGTSFIFSYYHKGFFLQTASRLLSRLYWVVLPFTCRHFSWHARCPACFSAFPLCIPVMEGVGRMGCLSHKWADPHIPPLDVGDTTGAVRSVPGVQGGSNLHTTPPSRQQRWNTEAALGVKMQYFSIGASQKCLCTYSCNQTSRGAGWGLRAAVGFLPSSL